MALRALGLIAACFVVAGSVPAQAGAGGNPNERGPDPLPAIARLHRAALALQRADAPRRVERPMAGSASVPAGRRGLIFYVDARTGNDSNPGTSPRRAWRSIARVDLGDYVGGDRILLHGEQHFPGTLRLTPANLAGTSARAWLTIGSYGGGRAVIVPGRTSGIIALNVSGVHVTGLRLIGGARGCAASTDGILFDASGVHGTLSAGIRIDHAEVSGFCDGVVIGSEDDDSRIDHVQISRVSAHDNGDAGVLTYDPSLNHHQIRDVSVTDTVAYRNSDQGGIALFGVERGVVANSVAFDNGRGHAGDVGIWSFDSDRIRLVYDRSYANMTIGDDGDGFDLDGGVTNSVMEHDYAHDNEGIGFLICACVGYWYSQYNDVVADDVSVDDGSSGQTSALYIGGGAPFHDISAYWNRAYSDRGSGPLVSVDGADAPYTGVDLRDNVFVADGPKPLLYADTSDARRLTLERDQWLNCSGAFQVQWGSRVFASLAAWQRATGAERGGSEPIGGALCSAREWRDSVRRAPP